MILGNPNFFYFDFRNCDFFLLINSEWFLVELKTTSMFFQDNCMTTNSAKRTNENFSKKRRLML